MTVTITESPRTNDMLIDIGKHPWKHRLGLKQALNDIGSEVVNETANLIFRGKRNGRVYNIRGARHQASAPGEVPATRSGRLSRSGDYRVRSFMEMTVGETAEHAGFLEHGTRNMDPRPHLIVAVNNKARDTEQAILENVERQIGA